MEWIDTWDCKSCGANNSESKEVCHKCGYRRKRLVTVVAVPWILAALVFGGIGLIKVYVDNYDKAHAGEHAEGGH